MSWDEALFRAGHRAIETFLKRRREDPAEEAARVMLNEVSARLALISGVWTGEKIEIKEAETIGGYVGTNLLLPASFAISTDVEVNWQAYLYRLVFTLCQRDLKLAAPFGDRLANERQMLLSVLSVPLVEREMNDAFPAIESLRRTVYEAALKKRIVIDRIETREDALEALIQIRLGRDIAETIARASELFRAWIIAALDVGAVSFDELLTNAEKLRKAFIGLPSAGPKRVAKLEALWGLVMNDVPESRPDLAHQPADMAKGGLSSGTEKKAKPKEHVEEVKLNENPLGDNPIVHSFEKLHTADEYKGGQKTRDAEDSLEEHAEALEELDLRQVVRSRERAESVYKADVMIETSVGDIAEDASAASPFSYDEWDEKKRSYKKNWCNVFVEHKRSAVDEKDAHAYVANALKKNHLQVRKLEQVFEKIQFVRRWRTRQPDGPEIDLDEMVDRHATVKSGHSPSSNLYLLRRRQERDVATLILLDASLSTDSWVQNRRVLDVAKESIIVLGSVVSHLRDKIAIAAFYSNTRRDCRYVEIKRFDESWQSSQKKLVGLRPAGYTRIGPAIRHSIHVLSKVPAKKKLVLLISDGKPTDFDRYEGRYGVADIRQAIREANQEGVHVKALAIDAQAKFYLPQMFGPENYTIFPRPELLSEKLGEIYGQIWK